MGCVRLGECSSSLFTAFDNKVDWQAEPDPPEPEVSKADARGPRAPWASPPMVNIYQPGGPVYLWLRLMPDAYDLRLEEHYEYDVGWRPRWLEEELRENGIDGIVQHSEWKPDGGAWGGRDVDVRGSAVVAEAEGDHRVFVAVEDPLEPLVPVGVADWTDLHQVDHGFDELLRRHREVAEEVAHVDRMTPCDGLLGQRVADPSIRGHHGMIA